MAVKGGLLLNRLGREMYGSFYDWDRSVTSTMRASPELDVPISKDDSVHYVVSSGLSTYGNRVGSSMIPLNRHICSICSI